MRRGLFVIALVVALLAFGAAAAFAESGPPVTNDYCRSCHSPGGDASRQPDFSMGSVDRSKCYNCHWLYKHFFDSEHVAGNLAPDYMQRQCKDCHHADAIFPTRPAIIGYPEYSTANGYFQSAASLEATPGQLHEIHTKGSWMKDAGFSECRSCHAAAACDACHSAPAASHADHTLSQPTTMTTVVDIGKKFGDGVADTYLYSSKPTGTYYASTVLVLGRSSSGEGRLVLRFPLAKVAGSTITSVTLNLTRSTGPDFGIRAYRLKRADWNSTQASWNTYKTGASWETSGAKGAGDYYATPYASGSSASGRLDVTDLASAALAEGATYLDLLVVDPAPVAGRYANYYSSKCAQPDWAPYLDVSTRTVKTTYGDAPVTMIVCNGAPLFREDISFAYWKAVTCVSSRCHSLTTPPADFKPACATCHPDRTDFHGYDPVMHTASAASESYSVGGKSYGPYACTTCHSLELKAEHASLSAQWSSRGCALCHPTPRSSFTDWNKSCSTGGCHTSGSSAPMHSSIDASHAPLPSAAECAACHAGDLAAIHSSATTSTPAGRRDSCGVCHQPGSVPASRDCASCHGAGDPHGDLDARHSAEDTASAGCAADGCHAGSTELALHAGRPEGKCNVCHANPTKGDLTAGKTTAGCTGCHTTSGVDYHKNMSVHVTPPAYYETCGKCHHGWGSNPLRGPDVTRHAGGCSTCHNATTDLTGKTTACDSCHDKEGAGGNYHPETVTIHSPMDPGSLACARCHGTTNVRQLHTGLGCQTCHITYTCTECHRMHNGSPGTPLLSGLSCSNCHTSQGTDYHRSMDTSHTFSGMAASCQSSGCHSNNLVTAHASYVGTGSPNPQYSDACALCHLNQDPERIPDGATSDCSSCHTIHTDPVDAHRTQLTSETVTILGTGFGKHECSECHRSTDVAALHGNTCATCHPSPVEGLGGAWSRTCVQGGCHAAGGSAPKHGGIDAAHSVTSPSCSAEGCHAGGGNIAALHSTASTTTPEGVRTSCQVCHAAGVTPTATCTTCHDMDSPHGGPGTHTVAAAQNGWVELFPSGEGPGCHGSECHGTGVQVDCGLCHRVADVAAVHNNDCSVCHPSPRDSFTNWTKGCQQGSCHPTYHPDAATVHDAAVNAGNCSCHPGNSGDNYVDPALCASCHISTGDTTPPSTTSNAVASYSGSTRITLTGTDVMPGTGAMYTYYVLDGAKQRLGESVYVAAPAYGSQTHTVQFWSVDGAGNVETPRKSAIFTVNADTIAPVTTTDAQTSYVVGAGTTSITAGFAVTDNGVDGARTYYRLDGGAVATGTAVVIPAPATGSASHTIQYWSVDYANNTETAKTVSFTITKDTTPPTTTFNPAQYYKTNTQIPMTAVDAGGSTVGATYYRYDNYPYWQYTAGYVYPSYFGLGTHTVYYYSYDLVGNRETTKSATLCYDTSLPITTSNVQPSYTGTATITLTPTDTYSGVATTYYRIDAGAQQTGTTISVAPPAAGSVTHTVYWWSVDKATNTETTKQYTFTVTGLGQAYSLRYAAGANGTLSGNTSQSVPAGGSGTAVTAVPNTGYHFVTWSDGKTANPRTDTNVSASTSVTASFAINTYTLNYAAGTNGTLSGTTSQTVGYNASGTAVTAVPSTGYHFVNWSDGSTANPRTDTNVTANKSVTANFAINTYTLTYAAGTGGTISGTTPQTVTHGASGSAVTAVPNAGYTFVSWSDGVTANPRTDTNVTAAKSVTATFAQGTGAFTITASAGTGGSISPSGDSTVSYGGSKTYAITPDAGYYISSVLVDGVSQGAISSYTFSNVTAAHTISVTFAAQQMTVYSYAYSGGTVLPLGYSYVGYGASKTITITPNAGYRIAGMMVDYDYVNGWSQPTPTSGTTYTFNNIVGSRYLYAYFGPSNTYSLIYTYGAHGYASPYGPTSVTAGSAGPTATANPDYGYHFVDWSDGVTANPRKDTNVTADKLVTPRFAPNTYTFRYTPGTNGTIAGASTQSVVYATSGTAVTAVPDAGYRFMGWTDGVLTASRTDVCNGDLNATAVFAPTGTYRLVYLANGPGTVTGEWLQAVAPGGSGTAMNVSYDSYYYQFDGWSDGRTDLPRTDTNVQADATITANFSQYYFGSCPFLFTYDGNGYEFEADLFTTGKLASPRANGTYQKPNPNDYYVLDAQPAAKDGKLEARLVEERPEADYLDEFKLYAVDVPAGRDVVAEKIPQGAYFEPLDKVVHTVSSDLAAVTAKVNGEDVSAKLAAADGACVILNPDQEKPSYQSIEMDLGDLGAAQAVKLVVEGSTRFPQTDAGKALGAGLRQKVEVIGTDGKWTALPGEWPKPAEFARPYLLDLTGKFPTSDHRVRLTFLLQTRIDSIKLDTTADEPLQASELRIDSAQLGHHGLDPLVPFGDLLKFSYGDESPFASYLPGFYTRFGDVTPLLSASDDEFVIFGSGDELTMRFDPADAPAEGTTRHYVVYANGYYKDLNTDVAHTVTPLPFNGMSNYPYAAGESYPTDDAHHQYQADWNTRYQSGL